MGRAQASVLFEVEALLRRARLHAQYGRWTQVVDDLDAARPLLPGCANPARLSQYAWLRLRSQMALAVPVDHSYLEQMIDLAQASTHPQLHWLLANTEAQLALCNGDMLAAGQSAHRQAQITGDAGMLEPFAEALLLQALACKDPQQAHTLRLQAYTLACTQGFAHLAAYAQDR
jgi:hypothetical protein